MTEIHFNADHVFRLARPENVVAGQKYMVVECQKCAEPIFLIPDPSPDHDPLRFSGPGKISTPCPSCFLDAEYTPSDAFSFVSDRDIQYRNPVVRASGSTRKLLSKEYPGVKPSFDPGWLEDRPEAAAAIGRCVAAWTEVENNRARLLGKLLAANTAPALAMFLKLRSGRAQSEVLAAVAEVVLDPRDLEMFQALDRVCATSEKERNHLAHGQYGGAPAILRGLLWIDPSHGVQHTAKVDASGVDSQKMEWVTARVYVYEPEDIQTVVDMVTEAGALVSEFISYLSPGWKQRGQHDLKYRQLCAKPPLARALRQIREGQKKTPQAPRGSRRKGSRP